MSQSALLRALAALDQGQNPNAPAVKREGEEDWGQKKTE
jgi:hypothetical protein